MYNDGTVFKITPKSLLHYYALDFEERTRISQFPAMTPVISDSAPSARA